MYVHSIGLLLCIVSGMATASASTALQVQINGPIGPAVAMHLNSALEHADKSGASLLILHLDTPGGLDYAMRDIIRDILASPVPVAAFVTPSGARAASAGTYILYASHIAAMAPATNLGAATPVRIGGLPGVPQPPKEEAPSTTGNPIQRKMVNDASAYIRSLAELRGRNADWAEKTVRQAASVSAEQALQLGAIDLIASNSSDLLRQLDGHSIKLEDKVISLKTEGMLVEEYKQEWRSQFLAIITDPNVAYILMLLGIYGLFFELANPGFVLPGVVGAICLLLALFAFQVLPINFAALALIILGLLFMIAELFIPSFGALGLGGIIAFVIGSLMLIDSDAPGYALSPGLVFGVAVSSALFIFIVISMALKARSRPVVSGTEEMIGAIATVAGDFHGRGQVMVHGEIWQAECPYPLLNGQRVHITAMHELILNIEPVEKE